MSHRGTWRSYRDRSHAKAFGREIRFCTTMAVVVLLPVSASASADLRQCLARFKQAPSRVLARVSPSAHARLSVILARIGKHQVKWKGEWGKMIEALKKSRRVKRVRAYPANYLKTALALRDAHRVRAPADVLVRFALTTLMTPRLGIKRRERAQRLIIGPVQRLVRASVPSRAARSNRSKRSEDIKRKGNTMSTDWFDVSRLVTLSPEVDMILICVKGGEGWSNLQLRKAFREVGYDPGKPVQSLRKDPNVLLEGQHRFLGWLLKGGRKVPRQQVESPLDLADGVSEEWGKDDWDWRTDPSVQKLLTHN
jgi:hypothetical protein